MKQMQTQMPDKHYPVQSPTSDWRRISPNAKEKEDIHSFISHCWNSPGTHN